MDQQLKNRRLAAVKIADAISSIESVPVSDYVRSLSERWAEGGKPDMFDAIQAQIFHLY